MKANINSVRSVKPAMQRSESNCDGKFAVAFLFVWYDPFMLTGNKPQKNPDKITDLGQSAQTYFG